MTKLGKRKRKGKRKKSNPVYKLDSEDTYLYCTVLNADDIYHVYKVSKYTMGIMSFYGKDVSVFTGRGLHRMFFKQQILTIDPFEPLKKFQEKEPIFIDYGAIFKDYTDEDSPICTIDLNVDNVDSQ